MRRNIAIALFALSIPLVFGCANEGSTAARATVVGLDHSDVVAFEPTQTKSLEKGAKVEITSPKHRDSVPRNNIDPPCQPGPGCARVTVEGKITPGYIPFLAVAPMSATPNIWIQPPVAAVRKDGSFEGLVYLGTERQGVGERFTLYVFGSKNDKRFKDGDVLVEFPKDCSVSEPVTVTRTK